jgi:hypothetical protein
MTSARYHVLLGDPRSFASKSTSVGTSTSAAAAALPAARAAHRALPALPTAEPWRAPLPAAGCALPRRDRGALLLATARGRDDIANTNRCASWHLLERGLQRRHAAIVPRPHASASRPHRSGCCSRLGDLAHAFGIRDALRVHNRTGSPRRRNPVPLRGVRRPFERRCSRFACSSFRVARRPRARTVGREPLLACRDRSLGGSPALVIRLALLGHRRSPATSNVPPAGALPRAISGRVRG